MFGFIEQTCNIHLLHRASIAKYKDGKKERTVLEKFIAFRSQRVMEGRSINKEKTLLQ